MSEHPLHNPSTTAAPVSSGLQEPLSPFHEGQLLCFDKPLRWTSFDVVNKVRWHICRHLGIKRLKVGHAGTLDPLATGVMLVCTGRMTKHIDELQAQTKEYVATLRLGATTPSYDLEHEIDATYPTDHITRELVVSTLQQFLGHIEQVPPAYSACKIDGHRAYDLARRGKDVPLKAKLLVIDEIELLDCCLTPDVTSLHDYPYITIRVVCSKGTYIRALARDIGAALGSGAHLTALRRTRVGHYTTDICMKVEDFPAWLVQQTPDNPKL